MAEIVRHEVGTRYSGVVVHNGTAYFAGLTADDCSGDVEAQTREVLAKADRLLAKVGADRSRLLSAVVWLRNIEDAPAMNRAWEVWVDPANPPARATVEGKLVSPDILVEIKFIVAVD